MPHIRVFFCFQLNAGILKAVEIRMDIEVGIDLECTILPDDQLVEPDDGKSTPQAVNDIIDDLIWRIEFVVWTDDLCQCVNSGILFVVQNEICQKQVALVRFNIFSGQCPFGADDLHAAKEINTMNKVLIIDDDKELCALIKRSVLSEDIEADFCNTGKEGLQKLKEREYQLVILDVMMPGMDGFETLEEIRKESSLPILMFTSKNDSASKVRGLRAGADDYLTKPFDMDELIARIVSLIRRYTRFNQQDGISQQLEFDGLKIDIENRSVTTENGTFELPPKEFDLLLYCAKNQGKILTKQQIYEEVWREEYFYDDSNIMAIISRLRKKLEVNPGSPKYIQTIKGIGYRFNKEV